MSSLSRRRLLLCVAACALVAASAAAQVPFRDVPAEPYLELEDAFGDPLPTFHRRGTTYVLGESGERYSVRLHNPTGERVEAVLSIDGRDAVSGRVADYVRQRGYIVPAYGSVRVDGFRTSLDGVATFRFSDAHDSYSARRGTPENVGVVGAAFFRERTRPYVPHPRPASRRDVDSERDSRSSANSASPARSRVNDLGTEFGESRESRVREVGFVRRARNPEWVTTLRYDDVEGLRARGIDWTPLDREPLEPDPFPANRFASPPPADRTSGCVRGCGFE